MGLFDRMRPGGDPKHFWVALVVIALIGVVGLVMLGVR